MKPLLQALLVADHVYVDQTTGKKVIAGIFHKFRFAPTNRSEQEAAPDGKIRIQIPPGGHRAGSPFCYISLTEVHNKQRFTLRYVALSDERVFFESSIDVDCPDPLQTVEIVLPLPMLPATQAGVFALELLWNRECIGSHRIIVEEVKAPEG